MIAFDFSYHRPATVDEAVQLFDECTLHGKKPVYLSGGTELITRARAGDILFDAVIDIKDILECNACQLENDEIVLGASVTLTKIAESGLFPFLTTVLKGIADHTSRNKITLGGNICSNLMYRESVLPFLLCGSDIVVAGKNGARRVPLLDLFDQALHLQPGELFVQLRVKQGFAEAPYVHLRKTKQTKIDYPLLTIVLLAVNREIRFACSGVHAFPFRSPSIEKILSDGKLSVEERATFVVSELAEGVVDDMFGSSAYRKFLLQQVIMDALRLMEGLSA